MYSFPPQRPSMLQSMHVVLNYFGWGKPFKILEARFTKFPLLCDNESAIKLANNPISHSRTKHTDIWHYFLRDHETKVDIKIHHVSTKKQLADIFTKPLDESKFCALRSELNILDSCNVVWTIAHLDWWTSMDRRNELQKYKYCA